MKFRMAFLVSFFSFLFFIFSCKNNSVDDESASPVIGDNISKNYTKERYRRPGIPLLTFDQAHQGLTEMGSIYSVKRSASDIISSEYSRIVWDTGNPHLEIEVLSKDNKTSTFSMVVETFSKNKREVVIDLPQELQKMHGFSARFKSNNKPLVLSVSATLTDLSVISFSDITVTNGWFEYVFPTSPSDFLSVHFNFDPSKQQGVFNQESARLFVDDIYLLDGSTEAFSPPIEEMSFVKWLKRSAIRFFVWNYRDLDNGRGVVPESSVLHDSISISGLGMALAAFVIAENEGMLSEEEALRRSTAIIRWIADLETQGSPHAPGRGGLLGFPYHYLKENGSMAVEGYEISTIDWAMCAAGLRLAKQRFQYDEELVSLVDKLISAPNWKLLINADNRVAMSVDANSQSSTFGLHMYSWGLAFSEETDLIYSEALASSSFSEDEKIQLVESIKREKKYGFYPSWFGAGFTYNWLQLWVGSKEPYARNASIAYTYEAETGNNVFGLPLMGLTATSVISSSNNGYLDWSTYISNQGADMHMALPGEVVQVAPAPYGAALAYPFKPKEAMAALKEFVKLGYYHPLIGLPEAVQIRNIPVELNGYWPANWIGFDISLAAMAMSLELQGDNTIAKLMAQDEEYIRAVNMLAQSFGF